MRGWPRLHDLSFDDLLWATASAILFFAALRGGELFTFRSSGRPILLGKFLSIIGADSGARPVRFLSAPRVQVLVQSPKTDKGLLFHVRLAVDPPYEDFPLRPSALLAEYRRRCLRVNLDVLGLSPAFRFRDGRPLSRDFMVGRAEHLAQLAGLKVLGPEGDRVPFLAQSWRSGYKLSAMAAGISDFIIGTTGKWSIKSIKGSLPYSFASVQALQSAGKKLVDSVDNPDAAIECGQFDYEGMFADERPYPAL